jgi:hypothetical protein
MDCGKILDVSMHLLSFSQHHNKESIGPVVCVADVAENYAASNPRAEMNRII